MRRLLTVLAGVALLIRVAASPASAITGGRPDGNAHPYVGIVMTAEGGFCSGALLSPTVFLTAGHCTSTSPSPAPRRCTSPSTHFHRGLDVHHLPQVVHPP